MINLMNNDEAEFRVFEMNEDAIDLSIEKWRRIRANLVGYEETITDYIYLDSETCGLCLTNTSCYICPLANVVGKCDRDGSTYRRFWDAGVQHDVSLQIELSGKMIEELKQAKLAEEARKNES